MKKEILIGILGIIAILIGSYAIWNSYNDTQQNISSGSLNTSSTVNSIQNKLDEEIAQGEATLSTSVIAQHNVENDCWLLIEGKVYDVSTYMIAHPGGKAIIIPYCGKDATTAFATKDGQGSHSSFAQTELQSLYVGTLDMPLSQIENSNANTTTETNTTSTPTSSTNTTTPTTSVVLDTATIAQHNTASNCWIIISSTVYAVSSYLSAHPGGSAIVTQYCGKDATAAFGNRGGTGTHSSFANSQLAQYAIGKVGSTTTTEVINSTQNTNTATSPSSNEDDGEEEKEEEENDD